jgi:hypothetical protein
VIAGFISMFWEMPMRPTPIVPTTVQEVPMLAETTAQIRAAVM